MASHGPLQCHICAGFYLPQDEEEHQNQHANPTQLAPRTKPNDLRKMELAKAIHAEGTDSTDIALRSLLP